MFWNNLLKLLNVGFQKDSMSRLKELSCILRVVNHQITFKFCQKFSLSSINQLFVNQNKFYSDATVVKSEDSLVSGSKPKIDLTNYGPVVLPTYNLAAYADESPLLQEFVKLGVELYKFDDNEQITEYLLGLDFEKHVNPYLLFLHDNGVPAEELGKFITQNPLIFKEDLKDLEVRINYLESKKFSKKMISSILTKNPKWLSYPVVYIDERLGFLQNTFKLKGDEVRQIITHCPSLIKVPKRILSINIFTLKEQMNLSHTALKKIVLAVPNLLKRDSVALISTFDYLMQTMKVSKALLCRKPTILATRKFKLMERHKFLESLGRAQYNPTLPGYVDLDRLVDTTDEEFCENIAKASIHSFNSFLKTL